MKKFATVLSFAILAISTGTVRADGIGLTVSGTLTLFLPGDIPLQPVGINYMDSANGAVPQGYGNSNTHGTAVIGSGIEFAATNGSDFVTVDFTGTTLTVTDTCLNSGCGTTPITLAAYSPYITGYSIVSDSIGVIAGFGNTFAFPGDAGAITFLGAANFTGGSVVLDYTSITPPPPAIQSLRLASFSRLAPLPLADPPAPVPEPASYGLVGTGLLGVVGLVRRRFRA